LRDPNQFFDRTHYRQPLARLVEADIAAALAGLR
jgi:predicted AAA+ superfamily ATPase